MKVFWFNRDESRLTSTADLPAVQIIGGTTIRFDTVDIRFADILVKRLFNGDRMPYVIWSMYDREFTVGNVLDVDDLKKDFQFGKRSFEDEVINDFNWEAMALHVHKDT
jgi:hypothetical protein